MEMTSYHHKTIEHTADDLKTHIENGISSSEAENRLKKIGYNELAERPRPGFLKMLAGQFNNFLVIILIIAAVISLLLGEVVDAVAIIIIVVLNSIVGVVQESKAEAALEALKKMSAPNAQVIRDGHQITIPSRELVPGDVVLLEAGNYIPGDMRLVESHNLKVEEASLTGESVPVEKDATIVLEEDIPLGDRHNSVYMGTIVTYGRGKGIVKATGMETQIGLIAEMLQSYGDEQTPLQGKLNQLAKVLGIVCLTVCGIIFIYGLIRDTHIGTIAKEGITTYFLNEKKDIIDLFMIAVSLAIAAIPEGLPAVVTICLALGMQKMIKRHALIRKLPAVETLGCATVICSDKTGTLTQNEMTIVQLWANNKRMKVSGEGYSPTGEFFLNDVAADPHGDPSISFLLAGGLLCNDAKLEMSGEGDGEKTWRIVGDPTEGAMIVAAAKAGLWRKDIEGALPRIMEVPFDSDRKRMSTIHEILDPSMLPIKSVQYPQFITLVKGAPDIILDLCKYIMLEGELIELTDEKRTEILAVNREMASQTLRVLAVAFRPMNEKPATHEYQKIECSLTFMGLVGMMDPARPEVKEAVRLAKGAGLKTVMITGDYKETAEAIAREIGIHSGEGLVLTGRDLDAMTDEELAEVIHKVDVCCRVSPQHKTKIVDAFKTRGHVVAMTGDGVNDAPALKRANIGIAMGITGTDVTRETADMVLTDDNFASIVSAIEEGRIIYANIRKFVFYLVSCNIGEILIIFLSMLFGMPSPLKPVQLLMLNLVTDGAPALALGMEKGDPDIMKQPPRPTKQPVINWEMQRSTIVQATVMTIAVLLVYYCAIKLYPQDAKHAQTIAFGTLCLSELLRAFTARSERHSIFSIGIFTNRWMTWAVIGSAIIVFMAIYVPFLQPIFDTVSLTFTDWCLMAPFIIMDSVAAEINKIFMRRAVRKKAAATNIQ
ncbi:MAG: ATPase [Syntrophus sp. (in: bacteria)]|nr:ATPase [Syntrophus sp. (in: bacteria)]